MKIHVLGPAVAVAFAGRFRAALGFISDLKSRTGLARAPMPQRCFTKGLLARSMLARPPIATSWSSDLTPAPRLARVDANGIRYARRAFVGHRVRSDDELLKLKRPYVPPAVQHVQQPDGTFDTRPSTLSEGEIEFEEVADAMERLAGKQECKVHRCFAERRVACRQRTALRGTGISSKCRRRDITGRGASRLFSVGFEFRGAWRGCLLSG